jgi:hypothetical protein
MDKGLKIISNKFFSHLKLYYTDRVLGPIDLTFKNVDSLKSEVISLG